MPKKSTTRSAAQRNKPKVQKNIALVRPNASVETTELAAEAEETPLSISSGVEEMEDAVSTKTATTTTAASSSTKASATAVAKPKATKAAATEAEPLSDVVPAAETAPKGSASARLAARRQAAQQKTQRSAPTLITAEHYAYVRKDLIYIAILAILMFATIIVLHFVPGIGA